MQDEVDLGLTDVNPKFIYGFVENSRSSASTDALLAPSMAKKILTFPESRVTKLRRLVAAVRTSLANSSGLTGNELGLFSLSIQGGGYELRVDEFACIDLFPGSPDYRFTISLRDGRQTLLVTDDVQMMGDFLCQYIRSRIECGTEFDKCS